MERLHRGDSRRWQPRSDRPGLRRGKGRDISTRNGNGHEPSYFRVRNWEKFQMPARSSGWKPPWCKLYHGALDDYEYTCLSLEDRGLLIDMYRLATRLQNQIPTDTRYIAHQLHLQDVNSLQMGLDRLMSTRCLQRVDTEESKRREVLTPGEGKKRLWVRRPGA